MAEAEEAGDVSGDGAPGRTTGEARGGWPADLFSAAAFLTRLPVPAAHVPTGGLAQAARAFPVVGAGVGAAAGGVLWLAAQAGLPPLVCALLALAAAALVTGALHEDGLADLADGLGGGRDREAKLRIMRDSRIGAFGARSETRKPPAGSGSTRGLDSHTGRRGSSTSSNHGASLAKEYM